MKRDKEKADEVWFDMTSMQVCKKHEMRKNGRKEEGDESKEICNGSRGRIRMKLEMSMEDKLGNDKSECTVATMCEMHNRVGFDRD